MHAESFLFQYSALRSPNSAVALQNKNLKLSEGNPTSGLTYKHISNLTGKFRQSKEHYLYTKCYLDLKRNKQSKILVENMLENDFEKDFEEPSEVKR